MKQNNIRSARKAANMTMKELGARIGLAESTISQYETGKRDPDNTTLLMIAEELNTSVSYLLNENKNRHPSVTDDVVRLPVFGEVAAGYEHICVQDWEGDTIEIPRSYLKGHPIEDYFMLRVKGDSMYPLYMDGDIVLVLRQKTLNRSGDIGVIRYDRDNATLKKVEYVMGEDWMKLIPINPQYPPMMIENEELELCDVLGVPRMVIREVQ